MNDESVPPPGRVRTCSSRCLGRESVVLNQVRHAHRYRSTRVGVLGPSDFKIKTTHEVPYSSTRLGPGEGGPVPRESHTLRRFRLTVPITGAESSGRRERVLYYSEQLVLAVVHQVS